MNLQMTPHERALNSKFEQLNQLAQGDANKRLGQVFEWVKTGHIDKRTFLFLIHHSTLANNAGKHDAQGDAHPAVWTDAAVLTLLGDADFSERVTRLNYERSMDILAAQAAELDARPATGLRP